MPCLVLVGDCFGEEKREAIFGYNFLFFKGSMVVLWVLTGGSSCDDRVRRLRVRSLLVVVSP